MLRRSIVKWAAALVISLTGGYILAHSQGAIQASEEDATLLAQAEISEIRMGIISTESQANQKPIWEPFVEAMSAEIGIPVRAFYATEYAGVIEAMRTKNVEMAWFGGKSYIEAAERSGAEAFALTVSDKGEKGYVAHLIMNAEHPRLQEALSMGGDQFVIEHAADLTFAFNDPNSTSGFLVPSYYVFAQNNANPNAIFKRLIFSGNHEATALAVANNQVDIATNNSESLQRLETTSPENRDKIEVIWTSPEIPSDPIAFREDLPEELKEKISTFFYTYNDPTVLGPLQWSGFEPADDSRWNTIRELEITKQILEVEGNESMNAEEKQTKLDELNAQLDAVRSN